MLKDPDMAVYREENFCPVAGVLPYQDLDTVIEMSNQRRPHKRHPHCDGDGPKSSSFSLGAYSSFGLRSEEHTFELQSR